MALNLPQDIKKQLLKYQRKWPDLPARWTTELNLHITMVFIGYVEDEEMLEICKIAKKISEKHGSIEVELNKICLAPPGKAPRIVWAMGPKNQELDFLKKNLEKEIFEHPKIPYQEDKRLFTPHVTLARLDQREWQKLKEKPEIEKEINLSFYIDSMDIMQSNLSRSGAEYVVLESVDFKG